MLSFKGFRTKPLNKMIIILIIIVIPEIMYSFASNCVN